MPSTVGDLLRDAAERLTQRGSETPRLDAEVLLGHVLRVDRATLLAEPELGVGPERAVEFQAFVERRARGEPVAYIRGLKEFYGLAFSVDARALIPRPETETLVELALELISAALVASPRLPNQPLRVWDVGTGSGAIAIAVAVESRRRGYGSDVAFYASDISADALGLAVENAVGHGVADVIAFATADLTDGAEFPMADVLLANLPYIATDVMPTLPIAASFEPVSALDGGPGGLDLIRRLIAQLPEELTDGGVALLEIGSDQCEAVVAAAEELGGDWRATAHDDLGGRPRVVEIGRAG